MKKNVYFGFLAFFSLLPSTSDAAVITPTAAFASTYYSADQIPTNLINNSGLNTSSGNVLTYTHASDGGANGMWHAGGGQGSGGSAPNVANQYVVLDLGANYDLSSAYLWQMIQPDLLGRGIKDFALYASSSAPSISTPPATYDLTGFTQILSTSMLTQASGTTTSTQLFPLSGATNVRQVYIDIISAWSGLTNDYVGLSEIKFEGTALPPPPTTTFNWNNAAGGAWQTAGNWSPSGEPTVNDDVVFNLNNTYTVTSGANVAVRTVDVLAGNVTLNIGSQAVQANTLNLSGGKLSVPALVSGNPAAGQVGYTSALNFTDGTLEVVGGIYSQPTGTISVVTPHTTTTQGGSWAISGAAGMSATPTLELINGAAASNTGTSGSIFVGINGGKAAINVRDAGSSLTTPNNAMYFGLGGAIVEGDFHRSESVVTVSDKALVSGLANIMAGVDGASGTIAVDDATLRSVTGNLILGWRRYTADAGREGYASIAVTNGGTATGGLAVYVGSRGGVGVATVDGEGSFFGSTTGGLYVGWERFLNNPAGANPTGISSNGTLTVTNSASAGAASVFVGTHGGIGTVNVDGATLAATNGSLALGYNPNPTFLVATLAGQGTLNITGGGVVSSTQGTFIGTHGGGVGNATVNGNGSTLTGSGGISVGLGGTGMLAIENGGTANSGDVMRIGEAGAANFAGAGTVGVDGENSSLNVAGNLLVGHAVTSSGAPGNGILNVTNSGRVVSTAQVLVGAYGGVGAVTVGKSDGTDSGIATISATDMVVGIGGSEGATLTVNPKGTVELSGQLGAYPFPAPPASTIKINLAGGTIKTNTTDFSQAAYLNWTSGTFWYTSGTDDTSWIGATNNDTLTVPVGGLLKGSTKLNARLAVLGTISPGDNHGAAPFDTRNLSIGNTGNQGTFAADIDFANSAADLLNVTGTVNLTNAALDLSLLNTSISGASPLTFLLINNDGSDAVVGTFASIDLGSFSSFGYEISYAFSGMALNGVGTGNDVAITFTPVPEPGTLLLLVAGLSFMAIRRRPSMIC